MKNLDIELVKEARALHWPRNTLAESARATMAERLCDEVERLGHLLEATSNTLAIELAEAQSELVDLWARLEKEGRPLRLPDSKEK